MPIPIIYLCVVLIWATTPLAIQWSTISFSPMASLGLRMLISLLLVALYVLLRGGAALQLRHWRLYLAASLGIFPTMILVYLASQLIPSGLVSVMFGLAPFMVALCSWIWLRTNPLDRLQALALLVSLLGLSVVCLDSEALGDQALWGILLMLSASFLFALSSLLVKQLGAEARPVEQLFGSLLVAVPMLGLCSWVTGTASVGDITLRSGGALLFLSVVGSFVGFLAYFRLVQALDVILVALIPLVTPVLALWLGASLNGEQVSLRLALGSALIIAGLGLFNHRAFSYLQRRI